MWKRRPETGTGFAYAKLSEILPSVRVARFVRMSGGIAAFEVSGELRRMAIPTALPVPGREYPLIRDSEIAARRTVTFTMTTGSKRILDGFEYLFDSELYQEANVDPVVKTGTAEEWQIVNNSDGIHPFHIHVNSFEVMGLA